jgi:hypothetical protein
VAVVSSLTAILAAAHRVQLGIFEHVVIFVIFELAMTEVRGIVGLAHRHLHPTLASVIAGVRPHWRNALTATVNRFTGGT